MRGNLRISEDNIGRPQVDVVVSAVNTSLPGDGVGGAIHRAALAEAGK